MLTITDNAGTIVSDLVTRAVPTTDTGGIRIIAQDDRFGVSVAESPAVDDVVVANGAARVFLEPVVAEVLDDKVLDAQVSEDGAVQFVIAAQPA